MKSEAILRHDLWKRIFLNLVLSLVGRISSSVRGVTLDFDGKCIRLIVYIAGAPSERDVDNMQDVEAELISHHDFQSDLVLITTEESDSLQAKEGNWGWVFLRDQGG